MTIEKDPKTPSPEQKAISNFLSLFLFDKQFAQDYHAGVSIGGEIEWSRFKSGLDTLMNFRRTEEACTFSIGEVQVEIRGKALKELESMIAMCELPEIPSTLEFGKYEQVLYTRSDLEELAFENLGPISQDNEALRAKVSEAVARHRVDNPLIVVDTNFDGDEGVSSLAIDSDSELDFLRKQTGECVSVPEVWLVDGDKYIT